jgi:hypothetical protein
MQSFGVPLFRGVIQTVRLLYDRVKDMPNIKSMVAIMMLVLAECSMTDDMTPYLLFGDLALRWMIREAETFVVEDNSAEDLGALQEIVSETDRAFKHLLVATSSCAISIASTRDNVSSISAMKQENTQSRRYTSRQVLAKSAMAAVSFILVC